jgi:GTPase SAR1 family protein
LQLFNYNLKPILLNYNPSDYYIAVLGYPRSGKSIFITSFIKHLISEKISVYKTEKIEKETAKRLNNNIKYLNSRTPIEQTMEESIFPYIVDISKGKLTLKKYFKLQIGDFSGDNSAQFNEGYRQWFHKSPTFVWVMQAHAFIFVVDLAEVLAQYDDDFYCKKVSDGIYEAWKSIEKSHLEGANKLKNKQIVLLFNKADLLPTFHELLGPKPEGQMRIKMLQSGFAKKSLPQTTNIKKDIDPDLYALIEEKFGDIIHYLKRRSSRFNIIYFSHFLTLNGLPIGLEKVADAILPR